MKKRGSEIHATAKTARSLLSSAVFRLHSSRLRLRLCVLSVFGFCVSIGGAGGDNHRGCTQRGSTTMASVTVFVRRGLPSINRYGNLLEKRKLLRKLGSGDCSQVARPPSVGRTPLPYSFPIKVFDLRRVVQPGSSRRSANLLYQGDRREIATSRGRSRPPVASSRGGRLGLGLGLLFRRARERARRVLSRLR